MPAIERAADAPRPLAHYLEILQRRRRPYDSRAAGGRKTRRIRRG